MTAVPDLQIRGLTKSFGGNVVLRGIDLTVRGGEFVGLMGPNGAGKSTLIKILDGVYTRSGGTILLGGQPVDSLAGHPEVGFIHQDLGLVDALSIADNLRLGERPLRLIGPILDRRAERESAERATARVGLSIPVDTPLGELTPGEKTLVAVARAFERGASILIVDESTSTLPPSDARRVIDSLAASSARGTTVIMVTHKLAEILDATNRVVVLLEGEIARDEQTTGLDRNALVGMLLQHESIDPAASSEDVSSPSGEVMLRLDGVRYGPLGPIDLEVRSGEVIGLSGLPGSGLHDIAFLAYGSLPPTAGTVGLGHPGVRRALVPPHRESQGGFGELSVRENMTISSLGRWSRFLSLINMRMESSDCRDMSESLSLRPRSIETEYEVLSGGNKQKVVFARSLLRRPEVYVLCEPTRGVDVGTRSEIYRLIRGLRAQGAAILIASSDAEDLLSVCDRVSIVSDGRLQPLRAVAELNTAELEMMI